MRDAFHQILIKEENIKDIEGEVGHICGSVSKQQADYRGTANTTQSGRGCQRWDAQSPHRHGFSALDENYCRNPDGEPRAWCYTTDAAKRWELCSVPFCDALISSPILEEENQEDIWDDDDWKEMAPKVRARDRKKAKGASGGKKEAPKGSQRPDIIHSRTVFLSSDKIASCQYHKCNHHNTTSKFVNELGELKEPLPPLEKGVDSCVPAKAWHSFNPLNCNTFHEEIKTEMWGGSSNDDNYIKYLSEGSKRAAWMYKRENEYDQLILKTLRWERPFNEEDFDKQRRDALLLERLTHSPHVINSFGYCGMSIFMECATGGEFKKRLKRDKNITPKDRFALARNISIIMADLREIGINDEAAEGDIPGLPKDLVTVVHHDFHHWNLLLTDDLKVKMSDFNDVERLMWDLEKNKSCGFRKVWWKNKCGGSTSKANVFKLAELLRFVLTKKKWSSFISFSVEKDGKQFFKIEGHGNKTFSEKEVIEEVQSVIFDGEQHPPEVLNSTDSAIHTIFQEWRAYKVCDVDKLPTAREFATVLDKAALQLGG